MFWKSKSTRTKKPLRRQRLFEVLENRSLMAANITSWINTSGGVLYVSGGNTNDNIQVRFENGTIGIRDGATSQIVKISVTDHGNVTLRDSIARGLVPYYVQVSTGEGVNSVSVAEDAANVALPLQIYGGQGNDILSGGSASDTIYGLGGNDTINGNAGNDYLVGGYGIDTEAAPTQGEVINGGLGNDTLIGGNGNDLLDGGQGDDSLRGLNGNDSLTGGPGINSYDGGPDTDTIAESELYDTSLTDSRFVMTRFNGSWNQSSVPITSIEMANLTVAANATTGVVLDASLFSGNVLLTGGPYNDVLKGGRGSDRIYGMAGDDTLTGGAGNNTLNGNAGTDSIAEISVAGASLTNGALLVGFQGLSVPTNDTLSEVEKASIISGPSDTSGVWFDASLFSGFTSFTGTGASDRFLAGSGGSFAQMLAGSDYVQGGKGNDDVDGGAGNDVIVGGLGIDVLRGGEGEDELLESNLSYAVLTNTALTTRYVKFTLTGTRQTVNEVDTLSGFEKAELSAQPMSVLQGITGVPLNASGFSGAVELVGNNGDDQLFGGSSSDTIFGGAGKDRIMGNGGGDSIYGGDDADVIWGDQNVRGIEDGNDQIYGESGNDTIYGGGGYDKIEGGDQNDTLYGDLIRDNLFDGRDQLFGGNGLDTLFGGGGNDLLYGGAFADADVLIGGAGADLFLAMYGEDNAVDFRPNSEDARIRFSSDGKTFWRDSEVLLIIPGLKFLADQTGNTRLLKTASQGEFEIQRVASLPSYLGLTVLAENDLAGKIRVANATFKDSLTPDTIIVHEVSHNWNDTPTIWAQWKSLSGWQPHDPLQANPPAGFTRSDDQAWDYRTTAKFARDYGRSNPGEDWATSWEAFYADKNGLLSVTRKAELQTKLSFIDQFIASLR